MTFVVLFMPSIRIHERYEEILTSDWTPDEKDRQFSSLISEMERNYSIPMKRDEKWGKRKSESDCPLP